MATAELPEADLQHVRSADGWLRLERIDEAETELAQVSADHVGHPLVLQARWRLACLRADWAACEGLARQLIELEPDARFGWLHLADTYFRTGRPREAFDTLAGALDRFEPNPTLPFHLARYACAMGDPEEGWRRFESALELSRRMADPEALVRRALDDSALAPLRERIGGLGETESAG